MCYSAAPSTTNQNATQRIYIYKGYKVARKSLQAYIIKMQYENIFKVIGVVHVIVAFLKSSPAAQTALKMALDTGTEAPQMDQRLLTNTWTKTMHNINIQGNKRKH